MSAPTAMAEQGYDMTKSAVIVVLALLAGSSVAAYGQSIDRAVVGPVHPGTAILDSMGIIAGVETPVDGSVHPGTALLDSMGIIAGAPPLASIVAGDGCQAHDLPQHGG